MEDEEVKAYARVAVVAGLLLAMISVGTAMGAAPVKIGIVGPLSGGAAMVGDTLVKGAALAIKHLNETGGIHGRQLTYVSEDDEQNPAKSVSAVNRLVFQHKVDAVVGTVNSSCQLACQEVTQRAQVPHVTPIASNPKVTRVGNKWVFRLQASDAQQCTAIIDYAVNVLKLKKLALMYQSDDYGTGGKDVIVPYLQEKYGMKLVAVEPFNPDTKDMSAQILKIKNAGADGLVMWTMYVQGALIARQAKQLGLQIPLMGGGGLTNPKLIELAGDASYGLLNTQTFFPDPKGASPEAAAFIGAYQKEYGVLPDSNAAMSYDAMMILGLSMRKAGADVNKAKVRDAMADTKGHRGVTGVIDIDEYGDANREILIIGIDNKGAYEVIWPKR